jgi:8-oxo-dGTP pyrophosphatase MutT (NUDIX family)
MNYCPQCGTKLESRWIEADVRHRRVCLGCGKVCYENSRILVPPWSRAATDCYYAGVLTRRRRENGILEQAAARETYEEAGVPVKPGVFSSPRGQR